MLTHILTARLIRGGAVHEIVQLDYPNGMVFATARCGATGFLSSDRGGEADCPECRKARDTNGERT